MRSKEKILQPLSRLNLIARMIVSSIRQGHKANDNLWQKQCSNNSSICKVYRTKISRQKYESVK